MALLGFSAKLDAGARMKMPIQFDTLDYAVVAVEDRLCAKIDTVNIKIDALEEKVSSKFEVLELKFTSKMNTMRWMMGALIFLVSGLLIRQLQT
jgi:hypothetical protein